MKIATIFLLAIALWLSISVCLGKKIFRANTIDKTDLKPEFKDNGKMIDSLKSVYNFEAIEYNNWDKNNAKDSSLTVSFINSKKLPSKNIDSSFNEFKAIAASFHRLIVNPGKYKSYYIIFVTRQIIRNDTISIHTAGMDVLVEEL